MHKVWAVIRREFVERVRTRAFVLSTILFPIFMAGLVILPGYLMSRNTGTKSIAFVDATSDNLGLRMATALETARIGRGERALPRYAVTRFPAIGRELQVRDSLLPITGRSQKTIGGFDGILVISDSTVTGGKAAYYGANVASFDDMRDLEQTLRPMVIAKRLQSLGVDLAAVMKSVQGIDLVTTKVADGKLTGESGAATFALAYAMGFILYFSLLIFGTQVMTSIIEEKKVAAPAQIPICVSATRPTPTTLPSIIWNGVRLEARISTIRLFFSSTIDIMTWFPKMSSEKYRMNPIA
jgi:ABC-2 type transport system permease protein